MGSRGAFLESGGFSAPAQWHTVDYVDGVKVLERKDPDASSSLPERSNTPGTLYLLIRKNGVFGQLRVFGNDRIPRFDIDYGMHQGKMTLHVHYYNNGIRQSGNTVVTLKPGDKLYEQYKRFFKGGKIMIGSNIAELKDKLLNGHEIEFVLNECSYSIEPTSSDGHTFLVIWKCIKNPLCIAKHILNDEKDIDALFNIKCLDGKSFYEVETIVKVESIF